MDHRDLCIISNVVTSSSGKSFRSALGFSSKAATKDFLSARDIVRDPDFDYLNNQVDRAAEAFRKLNAIAHASIRIGDTAAFLSAHLFEVRDQIVQLGLLPSLNNHGRPPEDVLFAWLRGHVFAQFFRHALSVILDCPLSDIEAIGNDDFSSAATFRRTARADFLVAIDGKTIQIEVECGFTGVNDVKKHKYEEAAHRAVTEGSQTLVLHADLFNGRIALMRIDNVDADSIAWVSRAQFEGQKVNPISDAKFTWELSAEPPSKSWVLSQ